MRSHREICRASLLLLSAGLFLQPSLAVGQPKPLSPRPYLTPDARTRLAEAAQDSALAAWQREFMLEIAQGKTEHAAAESSPPLPSVALRTTGTAADDGSWIAVSPPSGRYGHTAIYDPVRDRMVVFGGSEGSGYCDDVWTLSLAGSPVWSALSPAGSPPTARHEHTAIYDPMRDRMVVFGGNDGNSYANDVWALSLAGSPVWIALTATGGPPPARIRHTAIYDPVRDRMVVFGGLGAGSSFLNDVWVLSLGASPAWNRLAPEGSPPTARQGPTAVYDPVRDRMVVFGGSPGGSYVNDVWSLTLAESPAWSALVPEGSPPPGRAFHSAIYDPGRDRIVVFGGTPGGSVFLNDTWTLSLTGSPVWSTLGVTGDPPSRRFAHTAIYDPARDRVVVFGGVEGFGSNFSNDVLALSQAGSPGWSVLSPPETPPTARGGHTAIYDPVRDRMVVFGGLGGGSFSNDVWTLSLAGSPAWSVLSAAGTPPTARSEHTAIYDLLRERMVVFGGSDATGSRNDVWALSLAGSPAWSELSPTGIPPSGRRQHTAIYDPVRDRMVVFGGNDGLRCNDVWALPLAASSAWSALAPAGSPPDARLGHTAIYDPASDRMVVFGGSASGSSRNDVWALSLAGSPVWSELSPTGSPPSARHWHAAIFDPIRDRMLVFGGQDVSSPYRNDVWSLSLAGSQAWSALSPEGTPPTERQQHTAIYDPVRDRMVVFGGNDGHLRNDLWVLGWAALVSVAQNAPGRLKLGALRPNPSRGESTVDFELAEPTRVALEVFDSQGRRVRRITDEWFTTGRHSSTWRGEDDRGHALGSGVYFIRVHGAGFQATRRMVRTR